MLLRLLILLLLVCTSVSHGSTNHDEMLIKADKLKSSNPKQSSDLLDNIQFTQLTQLQKDYYTYLLAYNHFTFGRPLQAKELIMKLIEKKPLTATKLRAINVLLTVSMSTYDWPLAIQTAKLMQEQLSTTPNIATSIREESEFKIIDFYNHIGEHELAKNLAKSLITNVKSPRIKCMINAALLFSQMETTPESISPEAFYQAKMSCQKLNDLILENAINAYQAKYFLNVDKPIQALAILESNISDVKSTQYQALLASFYDFMAQGYLAIDDYEQAEIYAQILLDSQDQHQYEPSITSAYQVLAEVNKRSKNFEQALSYFQQYSEAKQLNLDQDNAKILALQKAQFDDVEKNTKIALLDKENALLKTQAILDSTSAQNKRLALALLTMVLIVFVLWTYKNRRNYLRMQHYAQTDELTGIANRHYFTQQANTAIKYCQRTDQPVSFIIFDLDYFKRINDSYGHQTGDVALKIAVDAAKDACRKNDIVGRLGGEEFGVLLPGCASHLAAFIAEKCRKAIEQADFSSSGHDLEVTASFGISDSGNCEYNFEKLFAGADFALYQSKDMGRNRIVQYQKEIPSFHI